MMMLCYKGSSIYRSAKRKAIICCLCIGMKGVYRLTTISENQSVEGQYCVVLCVDHEYDNENILKNISLLG